MVKKLPAFGYNAPANEIDFMWPTQAMFDQMRAEVHLKSMTFKYHNSISSVQCQLSNGSESPLFEKKGGDHDNPCTIEFQKDRIASVAAAEDKDVRYGYVWRLRFLNSEGQDVQVYNPSGSQADCTFIPIADSDQLIGVYGVYRPDNFFFKSFGFLVKTPRR
uniref:Uncharacterized protein n=1 Tax=Favella ehrenbergii TaxID=182087 RepID=A0A7S3HWE5_9SPIT